MIRDVNNESPDKVRRHWLIRLIEGLGIVMLVALGVGVVVQAFLWQLPESTITTAPSSSAAEEAQVEPTLPLAPQPLPAAEQVFEDVGAVIDGNTVTFPNLISPDAGISFDCSDWNVVLDGTHIVYALVGACESVRVVGTHIEIYIEQAPTLAMDGVHTSVVIGNVEELTIGGANNAVIADSVGVLAGDGSFPRLVANDIAQDHSDFTFGTVAVSEGLVADKYADSFSPELLQSAQLPPISSGAETLIAPVDGPGHVCDGERLIVSERVSNEPLRISGRCDTVILMADAEVEVAEADTVVALSSSPKLTLGTARMLVAPESGVDVSAQHLDGLIVTDSGVTVDADRIVGAIVVIAPNADVTWRSGTAEAVAPEGTVGFSGP